MYLFRVLGYVLFLKSFGASFGEPTQGMVQEGGHTFPHAVLTPEGSADLDVLGTVSYRDVLGL